MKRIIGTGLLFACTVILLLMALRRNDFVAVSSANGRKIPIYCVDTKEKRLALTFDVAWGDEDLDEILSILEKHKAHASFFVTGTWVNSFPDGVKAILAAGHDLGNHGTHHKNMSKLSKEDCREEIMAVHNQVKKLTGYQMTLFRPPYGDYDDEVIAAAKDCGYEAVQWSVDSLDWKEYGEKELIRRVLTHKQLENGAIILCHVGTKYTKGALDELLFQLEKEGYDFVPVSELIMTENYRIDGNGKQFSKEN